MKKLIAFLILAALAVYGIAAQTNVATFARIDRIDFEGQSLQVSEMEEIIGGLPRCCHDPEYDAIEDKCLNNKGQPYREGTNDCDIWVENVLRQAGIDVSQRWGLASSTKIKGHTQILINELKSQAPQGWSIQIIDNVHVALVRVNQDGSADVYHQGYNERTPVSEPWEGSRGYHYNSARSANWGDNRSFWDF